MDERQAMVESLERLRDQLSHVAYPFPASRAAEATALCHSISDQLTDYLIPRYRALDAPLLAVIGGSTGAGKSTLLNSLLRESVSVSSAIRPTTRRPILVHAPTDAPWFSDGRILPGLSRVRGSAGDPGDAASMELHTVSSPRVPHGLALLDSPDIDSVVEDNRALAHQLLAAADLWVFVTTAARYADAVPWELLDQAAARNIVVAVVLNRVPIGVAAEIRPDLAARMEERGVGSAPLFVMSEALDSEGFISNDDVAALRGWLEGVARDSAARESVARQTMTGALRALLAHRFTVVTAIEEQTGIYGRYVSIVDEAESVAVAEIVSALDDGTLLRGEVLARWQEIVGTGEWMKKLESGVSRVRDRVVGWFRGSDRQVETRDVERGIEDNLVKLLTAHSDLAVARVAEQWEVLPGGAHMLDAVTISRRPRENRNADAARVVQMWQRSIVEMVTTEGKSRRSTARVLSVGVNVLGVALMIVVFASTAGLTGGEVAVAGGTAVLAQRVLEAVFGDDAVRRMAKKARGELQKQAEAFVAADCADYRAVLSGQAEGVEGMDVAVAEAFDDVKARQL